jgi:hypothetical protein
VTAAFRTKTVNGQGWQAVNIVGTGKAFTPADQVRSSCLFHACPGSRITRYNTGIGIGCPMNNNDPGRWIDLPANHDPRGTLTSIEGGQDLPFEIQRIFYMHHMTADRGGHAHIDTDQLVIVPAGTLTLRLSNRTNTVEFVMNNPDRGLFIPRLVFIDICNISPDAVCLVLASTHYQRHQSLRDRASWLAYLEKHTL